MNVKPVEIKWQSSIITAYVLPDYEAKLRSFLEYANKFSGIFILCVFVGISGLIVLSIVESVILAETLQGFSLFFLGAVTVIFPFATPQTAQFIGLRSSIFLARFIGVSVIILGIISLLGNINENTMLNLANSERDFSSTKLPIKLHEQGSKALGLFMIGAMKAKSVHLSHIANRMNKRVAP
ncbi:MAG: hypothetical protein ACRCYY_20095 [Trueperaceae bacterium]